MKPIIRLVIVLSVFLNLNKVSAQCANYGVAPDSLQWVFDKAHGRIIHDALVYKDTLYLAGEFETVGHYSGAYGRVNRQTGKIQDNNSLPKIVGRVEDMLPDGSGGWIIVGDFTKVGDSSRKNLAQINSSNQVTSLKCDVNNTIRKAFLHGGVLYIGGDFTQVQGATHQRFAGVDLSTGIVKSWDAGVNNKVYAISAKDSTVYIGGTFSGVGGSTRVRVAAIDTSTGLATSWNTYVSGGDVYALSLHNNTLYLGGAFDNNVGGVSRDYLAAVDINTAATTSWNPDANDNVYELLLDRDVIYAAGDFDTIGGVKRYHIAAVDTLNGGVKNWDPGILNGSVDDIAMYDSLLYIGGRFVLDTTYDKVYIATVDTATGVATGLQTLCNYDVFSIQPTSTYIYVGGNFSTLDAVRKSHCVGINLTNNELIDFSADANLNGARTLAIDSDKLYIAGFFNTVKDSTRIGLACFDMANNYKLTSFVNPGLGIDIYKILTDSIYLYVAGAFNNKTVNSVTYHNIARIDKSTGVLDSWAPNFGSSSIGEMLIDGDDLYVNAGGMKRYNLSTSNTFTYTIGGGPTSIYKTKTKVYAAGSSIYSAGGKSRNRVCSFDVPTDTATDWDPNVLNGGFTIGTGVNGVIVLNNGAALIGGEFNRVNSNINGNTRLNIAMVDTLNGKVLDWSPSVFGDGFWDDYIRGFVAKGDTVFAYGDLRGLNHDGIYGLARFHMSNFVNPAVTLNTASTNICSGTSITITASANVTPLSYKWRKNGVLVSYSSTYSFTPSDSDWVSCEITNASGNCVLATSATSSPLVIRVASVTSATASLTAMPNGSICAGDTVSYKIATNINTPHYQWKVNNTNVGSNDSVFSYVPSNADDIKCIVAAVNGCYSPDTVTSDTITATVNPLLNPIVSVSVAPNDTVCSGTQVSFTATATNGGSMPSYQWLLNGSNVGTNTVTYSNGSVNDKDTISCIMTSSEACLAKQVDTSADKVITVRTSVTPSITIASNTSDTICSGTQVTFTATPVNGGASPTYQWYKNSSSVGTNASTYVTTTLSNKDTIRCVCITSDSCVTKQADTSNSIVMTVNQSVTPTIQLTASPNDTVCSGTNISFTAQITNGGASPTYQWKVNSSVVGSGNSYTGSGLFDMDTIQCVLTSNATCVTANGLSDSIVVNIRPVVTPEVTISLTPNDTVCSGTQTTFTAAASNAGVTPAYQWLLNGTAVGGNSNTYSTSTLSNNDTIRCVVISSDSCVTKSNDTSNFIRMEVIANTVSNASLTVSSDTVCDGTTVNFSVTDNFANGTYQWKVGTNNVGTNNSSYSYVPSNGDVVSCKIDKSVGSCYTVSSITVDTMIVVKADTVTNVSIAVSTNPFCPGDDDTLTASANVTPASYQWRRNGNNITGATASTYTYAPANNDVISCIVNATGSGCYEPDHDTSTTLTLTGIIPDTAKISITASSNPVPCAGLLDTFTATANISTGVTYRWKVNGNTAGANNTTYSYAPANGDIVTCDIIVPASGCYVKDTTTSSSITVAVTQPPSITNQPADLALTDGSNVQFSIVATGSGLSYQWQTDNGSGFNNITNGGQYSGATTDVLTITSITQSNNNQKFRCIVSVGVCPVTSDEADLMVNPVGVENINYPDIKVYPNPVTNVLTVISSDNINKLDVINLVGKKIYSQVHNVKELEIDMSSYPAGIYIVKVNNASVVRIVKK